MKFEEKFTFMVLNWVTEDLVNLNRIKAYSEFLLDGHAGEITEDQREAIECINTNASDITKRWDQRARLVQSD